MPNTFSGDIYFRIKAKGQYGDKFICRFAANTSFIKNNQSVFTKQTVDPCKIAKKSNYACDFKIEIVWEDVC